MACKHTIQERQLAQNNKFQLNKRKSFTVKVNVMLFVESGHDRLSCCLCAWQVMAIGLSGAGGGEWESDADSKQKGKHFHHRHYLLLILLLPAAPENCSFSLSVVNN